MRGVIVFITIVIFLIAYVVAVPPAVEGVGEGVKEFGNLDASEEGIIDNIYTALFVRIPLILIFGMGVFAVVWYIRRQVTVGVR